MSSTTRSRTPADTGYLPWLVHRISAGLLVVLLALHLGIQLYPAYGFETVYTWGIYGPILDLTLGVVLLHGVLGARATILETSLDIQVRRAIVWIIALLALTLFLYRLFG